MRVWSGQTFCSGGIPEVRLRKTVRVWSGPPCCRCFLVQVLFFPRLSEKKGSTNQQDVGFPDGGFGGETVGVSPRLRTGRPTELKKRRGPAGPEANSAASEQTTDEHGRRGGSERASGAMTSAKKSAGANQHRPGRPKGTRKGTRRGCPGDDRDYRHGRTRRDRPRMVGLDGNDRAETDRDVGLGEPRKTFRLERAKKNRTNTNAHDTRKINARNDNVNNVMRARVLTLGGWVGHMSRLYDTSVSTF